MTARRQLPRCNELTGEGAGPTPLSSSGGTIQSVLTISHPDRSKHLVQEKKMVNVPELSLNCNLLSCLPHFPHAPYPAYPVHTVHIVHLVHPVHPVIPSKKIFSAPFASFASSRSTLLSVYAFQSFGTLNLFRISRFEFRFFLFYAPLRVAKGL